jgi:hypothetical protein
MGWANEELWVLSWQGQEILPCLKIIHSRSDAHSGSYSLSAGRHVTCSQKSWADYSPPSSAKVKNVWNCISIRLHAFVAWCLMKQRENYTLILRVTTTTLLLFPLTVSWTIFTLAFHGTWSWCRMSFSEHSMEICKTGDCPLCACVHADRTKWNVI